LKRLISSFKDPSSAKKKPMKRENEGKRWGALGSSLWKKRKKNTHTHTHGGSLIFWGKSLGRPKEIIQALGKFF
jgi:hypothetical protein